MHQKQWRKLSTHKTQNQIAYKLIVRYIFPFKSNSCDRVFRFRYSFIFLSTVYYFAFFSFPIQWSILICLSAGSNCAGNVFSLLDSVCLSTTVEWKWYRWLVSFFVRQQESSKEEMCSQRALVTDWNWRLLEWHKYTHCFAHRLDDTRER